MSGESHEAGSALDAARDRVIEGVDIYVAGVDDRIETDRRLTVQETAGGRWVGSIDANLASYSDVQLEVQLPDGISPPRATFVVGPRFRGATLIRGVGPPPR
ncbi:MAG TPA: hypothetical protein VHL52_00430 [Acidimicrobiia bacterium]|nr:hypothetical protein [Acidimicrobiia bacterium]